MLMVILGAGASYDSYGSWPAGMQRVNRPEQELAEQFRPPLTKNLFEERRPVSTTTRVLPECAGWVGYMRQTIRQQQGNNVTESVEEVLARLAASPNPDLSKRATLAIRLFMQHMLTECQISWLSTVTSNVTNYGMLLAQISVAGITDTCFVSFNYDTLLEQALPTVGVSIDSLDSYITHPAYKLVKPHGSLNWAHEIPAPPGVTAFNGEPVGAARWLIAHAPEVSPLPDFSFFHAPEFAVAPAPKLGAGLWPAIALPVAGKADFECPKAHLDALEGCLPKVTRLLTIGWRGVEQHFFKIVAGKFSRRVSALVVGQDRADADDIASTLSALRIRGRFAAANGGFTESLRKEIPAFLVEQLPS